MTRRDAPALRDTPFHRLPERHVLICHDLAEYAGRIQVLLQQLRHVGNFLVRKLPATAHPYREDLHMSALDGLPAGRAVAAA